MNRIHFLVNYSSIFPIPVNMRRLQNEHELYLREEAYNSLGIDRVQQICPKFGVLLAAVLCALPYSQTVIIASLKLPPTILFFAEVICTPD